MSGGRPSEEKRKEYAEKLKWVDLAKYKGIRDLDALGWRDQLAFRRDLMDKAKFWIAHRQSEFPNPEIEADLRWLFGIVQETPIVDLDQLGKKWPDGLHDFPMLFFLRNTSSYSHLAVHPITIEEFYLAEAFSDPQKVRYARDFFNELGDFYRNFAQGMSVEQHFDSVMRRFWEKWDAAHSPAHGHLDSTDIANELKYEAWMEEPIQVRSSRRVFLSVDPSAPDTRLEKQFKAVLAEYRATSNRLEMPVINPDSWADAGLLPYLDIRLWSLLNDEPEIDPFALRDAILPPWRRTDYTVRRVTEPVFDRLMKTNRKDFEVFVMMVAEDLLLWSRENAAGDAANPAMQNKN